MKTIKHTMRNVIKSRPVNAGKGLLILCLLLTMHQVRSQDYIVLKNGDEIKAKVTEISDQQIKYLQFDEQNGISLSVPTSAVFMIRYQNGTKEVFESKAAVTPSVVIQQPPTVAPGKKFDNDTSDFAKIRRKKFNGPRIGVTWISPGTSADYLLDRGKRPLVTQFGWQFEGRLFTVEETSGIIEFVPMIGGLEQGLFIPSASFLLGVRTGTRFIIEFAIGPNFSVVPDYYGHKKGFAGVVLALGTSLRKGNVYFPITIAYVPSVGNVADVTDQTTGAVTQETYHTGSRVSLIVGFNSRKK